MRTPNRNGSRDVHTTACDTRAPTRTHMGRMPCPCRRALKSRRRGCGAV
jgi:hypothetical protein